MSWISKVIDVLLKRYHLDKVEKVIPPVAQVFAA